MNSATVTRPPNENAPVTDFNHLHSRPRNEQYALGANFRQNSPIVYSEAHGGVYYVASYDLIKQVLMDPHNFSNFDGVSEPGHKFDFEIVPSQNDPPDHSRYRNALQSFLRPTAIKKHEDLIREIVIESMQGILAKRGGDVISEFAIHVPLRVTSAVLGYTEAEAHRLHNSFEIMLEGSLELDVEKKKLGMDAFLSIIYGAYDRALANEPDETLVSQLVHQVFEGERFNREETLGMVSGVTIGAIDTTKHSITNAIYLLAQWPEALRDLLADRSLIPAAVEEVLRLEAVAYFVARTVRNPVTLGGVDLKPGARVVMAYAWANRDEQFFPDADKFDIHRKRNHHFGFGHGVHSCLGMHLARMELRIALEEILDRMPRFELVSPIPNAQSFGSVIYGFEHLNIAILD